MKVFIDTEFYEFQPKTYPDGFFNHPDHSIPGANAIQLISFGAVREDGAEFYAENAEFDWSFVPKDHWIQDNVRPHLISQQKDKPDWMSILGMRQGNSVAGGYFEPSQIAQRFWEFACTYEVHPSGVTTPENVRPEFWGYFCDYDWVVLCGLYGRMVDLPPEFPKYCLDLKQEMHRMNVKRADLPTQNPCAAHHALDDARWVRDAYNFMPGDAFSDDDESSFL